MDVLKDQVFNLMDTNGRRGDVINALDIYLNILEEENKNEGFLWASFPKSLSQFNFYKSAIELSTDVFKKHPRYDAFYKKYHNEINLFNNGHKDELCAKISRDDKMILDKDIEQRARHYSSNLCKIGFSTDDRKVTKAGEAFLNKCFEKDEIEKLLPLTNANIVILRQLLKLRIYSKQFDGKRAYYSPVYCALYLLLQDKHVIDNEKFEAIVQTLNPYYHNKDIDTILDDYDNRKGDITDLDINVPKEFCSNNKVTENVFSNYMKNRKASSVIKKYYEFYNSLYEYVYNGSENELKKVLDMLKDNKTRDLLKKAFGYGNNIFNDSSSYYSYGIDTFLRLNKDSDLLSVNDFNRNIFIRFYKSKHIDSAREYFDTTKRMLSATGIFRFDKAYPVLSYKELLRGVFDLDKLKSSIFGESNEEEYFKYEGAKSIDCTFYDSNSIKEILNISPTESTNILNNMEKEYGTSRDKLQKTIKDKANLDFMNHINSKYTKEYILDVLKLFSDRNNDELIKKMVNPEADVPTIFEFVIAIAWYYISDKTIDLFDSMNLTLNAEFEPILHAGGGDGDIISQFDDITVMLEVTLMNRNAQKRGEMEPVLRHSTNLREKYSQKDTLTLFVADELDFSTVMTWRVAVLAPRLSSNGIMVDNIKIMSFKNSEICSFIEKGINSKKIIKEINNGFMLNNFEPGWRESIVSNILA